MIDLRLSFFFVSSFWNTKFLGKKEENQGEKIFPRASRLFKRGKKRDRKKRNGTVTYTQEIEIVPSPNADI